MQEVRREVGFLSDTMGGLSRMGRLMTFGLTIPILGFGAAAAKVAGDFEAEMRNVAAISSDVASDLTGWSDRIQEIGERTRGGPIQAAQAFYEIFSAGVVNTTQALEILDAATIMAEAGLSDLDATALALTTTMNVFGDTGLTAAAASDVWLRTVQLGVGSLEEFQSGAKFLFPTLDAVNAQLQDGAALWAIYSQTTGESHKAARGLNQAITNMIKPNEVMAGVLERIGATSFEDLLAQEGSLEQAFIRLRGGFQDGSEIAQAFSVQGALAFNALTGNVEQLHDRYLEFTNGLEGAALTAWEQQMGGLNAQVDLLKSAFESFMITVGNALIPILIPIVQGLRDAMLAAGDLSPEVIQLGIAFAALVAAAGPLMWLLGSLTSPFVLIGGAIAAFLLDVGGVRTALEAMIPPDVLAAVNDLKEGILEFFRVFTGQDLQQGADDFAAMFDFEVPTATVTMQDFTVVPGDTPGELAARLGVTVQDILDATGAASAYTMPIGDFQLEIPGLTTGTSGGVPFELQGVQRQLENMADTNSIGTSLGDRFSAAVDTAWPKISDALIRLKDSFISFMTTTVFPGIGNWIQTDGANLLGTALGTAVGTLGTTIVDALNGGTVQGPMGTQIEQSSFFDNFVEGLRTGFENAIQNADLTSVGDVVIIAIAGAIGLAATASLVGNLLRVGLVGTISSALSTIAGQAAGLPFIAGKLIGSLASSVANYGAGPVVKAVGDGIYTVANNPATFVSGAGRLASSILGGLGTALRTAGAALLSPIGAALSGVIIGALAWFSMPQEFKDELTHQVRSAFDFAFGPGTSEHIAQAVNDVLVTAASTIGAAHEGIRMQAEDLLYLQGTAKLEFEESGGDYRDVVNQIMGFTSAGGRGEWTPPVTLTTSIQEGMTTAVTDATSTAFTNAAVDPAVIAASETLAANTTVAFMNATNDQISSGETNPTVIANSLTQPIADAFTTAFGPEGTIGLIWNAFVLDIGTDLTLMGENFLTLQGVAVGAITGVANGAVTHFGRIRSAIYGVVSAINSMIIAIHGLQSAMGSLSTTNMSLPPTGGTPPGHAMGGWMNPGDVSIVGESGPELFSSSRRGFITPNSALRGALGSGGGGNVNYITIEEANNVDQMLFEMKRRGIKFENG